MTKQSEEIKIEKGVPLPQGRTRGVFLFMEDMQIGDSAFVPRGHYADLSTLSTSLGYIARRHPNKKFAMRRDREANGVRIWRVE